MKSEKPTILLADDEPSVRSLVRRMLTPCGYGVLEAGSGAEALEVAACHGGAIRALIADDRLPGMTGREMAEQLARERPGLAVLLIWGDFTGLDLNGMPHHWRLLAKPLTPWIFRLELSRALDRGAGGSDGLSSGITLARKFHRPHSIFPIAVSPDQRRSLPRLALILRSSTSAEPGLVLLNPVIGLTE